MSNWKDTVMSDEDLQSIEELELYHFKSKKLEKAIAQAQAEISFKAGIKEMAEWIKERDCGDKSCVVIAIDDWQAKLKEWGIEWRQYGS